MFYQSSPTKAVDVVVPEQIVASVTHVVQDSETGPDRESFLVIISTEFLFCHLILVIGPLTAEAGKVAAVRRVEAESSHGPRH